MELWVLWPRLFQGPVSQDVPMSDSTTGIMEKCHPGVPAALPSLCALQELVSPGRGIPTALPTLFPALWPPRILQAHPTPSQPANLQPPRPPQARS